MAIISTVSALFRFAGSHTLSAVPLQIDGSDIKFLREALRAGCRFVRLTPPAKSAQLVLWQLEFFVDTRFEVRFMLISRAVSEGENYANLSKELFSELAIALGVNAKAGLLIDSGRLIWQQMALEDGGEADWTSALNADALTNASIFLRGTKSLTRADFSERSKRWLALDPRGIALMSKLPSAGFILQRYSVLLALLRAYQFAVDTTVDQLAKLTAESEALARLDQSTQASPSNRIQNAQNALALAAASTALSHLQRDALVFSARFLFARPVRLDTVDLRYVWDALAGENHLLESHAELTEQLGAVHSLLLHDEEKRSIARDKAEELREKRGQTWLTVIGLCLAILSLLSLVDITPAKFQEFWRAWFG